MAKLHTGQRISANAGNNAGLPQQISRAKTPRAQKPNTSVTNDSPAGDVAELLPAFPANGTPVSACLARMPGWHDNVAANFRAAFTDCLLVPVKPGVTEQALQNLPLPSAVEASTNHHKADLCQESITVICGERSNRLAGIEFTAPAEFTRFLQANPNLAASLITAYGNKVTIWVFARGPSLCSIDLATVPAEEAERLMVTSTSGGIKQLHRGRSLSDTSSGNSIRMLGVRLIVGGPVLVYERSRTGLDAFFFKYAHPVAVDIESLHWEPGQQAILFPKLAMAKFGAFAKRDAKGKLSPNSETWADYFARTTGIFYSLIGRLFWRTATTGLTWLDDGAVMGEIEQFYRQKQAHVCIHPIAASRHHLELTIHALKSIAHKEVPGDLEIVRRFAVERLYKPGRMTATKRKNLTMPELYAGFCLYVNGHGLAELPERIFSRCINCVLRGAPFFLKLSKSIPRPPGNGYRNLALKGSDVVENSGVVGVVGVTSSEQNG